MKTRSAFLQRSIDRYIGRAILAYRTEDTAFVTLRESREELSKDEQLTLAAFFVKSGDLQQGLEIVEQAAGPLEIRIPLLLELRELEKARQLLSTVVVESTEIAHCRAMLVEEDGDEEQARSILRQALSSLPEDDFLAADILRNDLARLQQKDGATDDTITLCGRVARGTDRSDEAAHQLALLYIQLGETHKARSLIETALASVKPSKAIAEGPSLASLLAECLRSADLTWIAPYPELATLASSNSLGELGLRFVGKDEAIAKGDALRLSFTNAWPFFGIAWSESLQTECARVAAPLVLLADGPKVPASRMYSDPQPSRIFVNLDRPEELWIAPPENFPPALFTSIKADATELATALAKLFPEEVEASELSTEARAFMGYFHQTRVPSPYSGELEPATPHALDRFWAMSSVVDGLVWGSRFDSYTCPNVVPTLPLLDVTAWMDVRRAQAADAVVGSLTRRTNFSRSYLGVEMHMRQLPFYAWAIRYRPNPYPETIERFNQRVGTNYPTDLPADVVATLYGFEWIDVAQLTEKIDGPSAGAAWDAILGLRRNETSVDDEVIAWLTRSQTDSATRARIANACLTYGRVSLLERLAANETDPELRAGMVQALQIGFVPPQFDSHGEPVGMDAFFEEGYQ